VTAATERGDLVEVPPRGPVPSDITADSTVAKVRTRKPDKRDRRMPPEEVAKIRRAQAERRAEVEEQKWAAIMEDVDWMVATGETCDGIGRRLGTTYRNLQKQYQRRGLSCPVPPGDRLYVDTLILLTSVV